MLHYTWSSNITLPATVSSTFANAHTPVYPSTGSEFPSIPPVYCSRVPGIIGIHASRSNITA